MELEQAAGLTITLAALLLLWLIIDGGSDSGRGA